MGEGVDDAAIAFTGVFVMEAVHAVGALVAVWCTSTVSGEAAGAAGVAVAGTACHVAVVILMSS